MSALLLLIDNFNDNSPCTILWSIISIINYVAKEIALQRNAISCSGNEWAEGNVYLWATVFKGRLRHIKHSQIPSLLGFVSFLVIVSKCYLFVLINILYGKRSLTFWFGNMVIKYQKYQPMNENQTIVRLKPVSMYGCQTWKMNRSEKNKINVFQNRCLW